MHIDIYSKMDLFLIFLQFHNLISWCAIYLILINESLLDLFALGLHGSFFVGLLCIYFSGILFQFRIVFY